MPKSQKKKFDKNAGLSLKQDPNSYPRFLLPSILCLTAVVFANTLGNDFINNWDDRGYVLNNEAIRHLNWKSIEVLFSSFYQSNYHPLTVLSYAAEYKFFGPNPFYFHLTNYILHLLNVLLVYTFIKRFTGKPSVAAITSLFFAIHPMHVESIAWISERKDLLYTLFFLLSLNSYINYLHAEKKVSICWSFVWFFFSLLSKPAAVCLPLVLVLMDYYYGKKISRKIFTSKIAFFAGALLFGFIAISAQSSGAIQNITPLFSIFDRIFLVSYSILYYLLSAFAPFRLCALHYYPLLSGGMLPLQYYLALPSLILLIWAVLKSGRFKQELIFGLSFYLITIAMVLQIIPVGQAIVSERYSYVPYIGVFFIFGQFFSYLKEGYFSFSNKIKSLIPFVLILLTIFYSFLSYGRNKVWKNGVILFTDVIDKYPEEGFGWNARGYGKNEQSDTNGAIADYNKAIELTPENPEFYFNRGNLFVDIGKFDGAIADYTTAIYLKPDYSAAFCNRGLSFRNLKQMDASLSDFNKAIALDPKSTDAYFNRGNTFYEMGEFGKAIADYTSTVKLDPYDMKAFYNRGIAKFSSNDKSNACNDWYTAQQLGHTNASVMLKTYCK